MSSIRSRGRKGSQKTKAAVTKANAAEDGDNSALRESEDMEAETKSAVNQTDGKLVNGTTQNQTLDKQIDGDESKNSMPM
jgi:hypothetical protein